MRLEKGVEGSWVSGGNVVGNAVKEVSFGISVALT
jgi:hypothetical protein